MDHRKKEEEERQLKDAGISGLLFGSAGDFRKSIRLSTTSESGGQAYTHRRSTVGARTSLITEQEDQQNAQLEKTMSRINLTPVYQCVHIYDKYVCVCVCVCVCVVVYFEVMCVCSC
jgi:hypothetical protein